MAIRAQEYNFPDSPDDGSRLNFESGNRWPNWRDREKDNFLNDSHADDYLLNGDEKSSRPSNDFKQRENAYNKWKNENNILSISSNRKNKSSASSDTWSNWREQEADLHNDDDNNQPRSDRRKSERDIKWGNWREQEAKLYNEDENNQPASNRRKSERDIKWGNWRDREKTESKSEAFDSDGMKHSQSWSNWREKENANNFDDKDKPNESNQSEMEPNKIENSLHKPMQWENWREMEKNNDSVKKFITDTIMENDEEEALKTIDIQPPSKNEPQNQNEISSTASEQIFKTIIGQELDYHIAPNPIESTIVTSQINNLQIASDEENKKEESSEISESSNEASSTIEDTPLQESNLQESDSVLIERGGQFELIGDKDMQAQQDDFSIQETASQPETNSLKETIAEILNGPAITKQSNNDTNNKSINTSSPSSPKPIRKKIIRPRTAPATIRRNNEYDYIQSSYGLTPYQKQLLAKKKRLLAEMEAERKLKEEETKRKAREDAEAAFRAWLQSKREEAFERRLQENNLDPEKERKKKELQAERCREVYQAWLRDKADRVKQARKLEDQQRQEEDAYKIEHSKRQCEKAFTLWLRRKAQEKKAEEMARIKFKRSQRRAKNKSQKPLQTKYVSE
ncbi:uncharacterized protein TRIADDRAFT_56966 [Trichoplax adhaerens]|uniref:Coiled-coil domain-containing protein 181 n=1 Tax=Trichoplax adhaerens TaxID=10228 RepID=B3RX22_TRIAD|nr:hypothetical protein TRIADDRAFT_56966 [Trichoplax adhaerens]EDV24794.1 hypothetical protein TRIADDRAFT_56966 [Trichoplax adhaerens]|eukprot:XP_002112684.1 hypothetical protein TRIADDRAFT_56966 [Trichoplax adhaerens]